MPDEHYTAHGMAGKDPDEPDGTRRRLMGATLLTMLTSLTPGCALEADETTSLAQGVVWQIDENHIDPHGNWDKLGVHDLLVQWTAVDGLSFLPGAGLPMAGRVPDWTRIADERWARNVIVGLAGRFDETTARAQIVDLIAQSVRLAAVRPPVHVAGWYFPVEIDPTWVGAAQLGPLLATLPRPLWVSIYDRANVGGRTLAKWLDTWLPKDVGVFFQDGCGVYARGPMTAREYADALSETLGKSRVRIIAEAFRPQAGGGFRAATSAELLPQLVAYKGYRVYLFDGPHYVSAELVDALLKDLSR
jgi:hypothetical protein